MCAMEQVTIYSVGTLVAYRSCHRRCSTKKCVLENFAKIQGKTPVQSLFSNKVTGLRPATLLRNDSDTGVFQ